MANPMPCHAAPAALTPLRPRTRCGGGDAAAVPGGAETLLSTPDGTRALEVARFLTLVEVDARARRTGEPFIAIRALHHTDAVTDHATFKQLARLGTRAILARGYDAGSVLQNARPVRSAQRAVAAISICEYRALVLHQTAASVGLALQARARTIGV